MNELNFLDLAILKKVDAESTVEKFGSMINTSFFETANLLGTIKIKGYINIESSIGGMSKVTLTDAGTSLLAFAEQKAGEPIEPLDNAILHALAGGARELEALQHALNIRSADLAYHVDKLVKQGFMDFEIRSAKAYFVLTEMGFNSTGGVRVQQTLGAQQAAELKARQAAQQSGEAAVEKEAAQPQAEEKGAAQAGAKEGEAAQAKPLPASAPPWVNPAEVRPEKEAKMKEDVAHIMAEAPSPKREKEAARKPRRKEPSPEDMKNQEKTRRLVSKMQYYAVEYAPYIFLIAMVLAAFAGAIFLSLNKLA